MRVAKVQEAGAIAFKLNKTPRVLLIRSKKNPRQWIFPKGHVEPGEKKNRTAIRELREEAGVDGVVVGPAGVSEYLFNEKGYHVTYYAVRYKENVGSGEQGRTPRWCTLTQALDLLTYEDTRELLKKAVTLL